MERGFMIKKISSWFLIFLSALLTVFLTFSIEVKWNLEEKQIVSYLQDADISFLMDSYNGVQSELYQNVLKYLEAINVPEETMEEVLNSESTKKFVGKYLANVFDYLIYQKEDLSITKEEVLKLVEDNLKVISSSLQAKGLSLSEEEQAQILKYATDYSNQILEFFPTAEQIITKLLDKDTVVFSKITLEDFTSFLRFITDPFIFSEVFILLLLFLMILFFINRGKRCFYFKKYFFFYALILVFGEILLGTVVKEQFMNRVAHAAAFINYMINEISKNLWIVILLAIFISFVLSKIERKGFKNEKISTELCEGNGEKIKEQDSEE